MAEFRSIKDRLRDPLILALLLVVITGLLAAVVGNLLSNDRGPEETRATDQPSTQSIRRYQTPIHAV